MREITSSRETPSLYTYKDKMEKHDNPESRECYKLVCDFLAYAKETGMTVMVEEE